MKIANCFLLLIISCPYLIAQQVIEVDFKTSIKELTQLNSIYRETNPSISTDGKELFYFSRRGGMSWNVARQDSMGNTYYEGDIYTSIKTLGKWSQPKNLIEVNTSKGQDEPVILGNFMYYQDWEYQWYKTLVRTIKRTCSQEKKMV